MKLSINLLSLSTLITLLISLALNGCSSSNQQSEKMQKLQLTPPSLQESSLPEISGVALISRPRNSSDQNNLVIKTTPTSPSALYRVIQNVGLPLEANPYIIAYTQSEPNSRSNLSLKAIASNGKPVPLTSNIRADDGTFYIHEKNLAFLNHYDAGTSAGRLEILDHEGTPLDHFIPIDGVKSFFRINDDVVSFLTHSEHPDDVLPTLRVLNLDPDSPSINLSIREVVSYEIHDHSIYYVSPNLSDSFSLKAISLNGDPVDHFHEIQDVSSFRIASNQLFVLSPFNHREGIFNLRIFSLNGEQITREENRLILHQFSTHSNRIASLFSLVSLMGGYDTDLMISDLEGHPLLGTPIQYAYYPHGVQMNSSVIAYDSNYNEYNRTGTLKFINHQGGRIPSMLSELVVEGRFILF